MIFPPREAQAYGLAVRVGKSGVTLVAKGKSLVWQPGSSAVARVTTVFTHTLAAPARR